MRIRFQADADLDGRIVRGLKRRAEDIDIRTATDAGIAGLKDPDVLQLSAETGRVLVSQDRRTMPAHLRSMSRPPTVPALSSSGKRFPSVLRSRNSCSYRLPVKPRSGSTVWRGFLFELSGNVNLVGKSGGHLVGKKARITDKTSQYRKRKRLKSQHGQIKY